MPVEAIGSAAGFTDVVESGCIVLANGETKARLGVGAYGGKVLLEYDPVVTAMQASRENNNGLVHLRFPRVGDQQVLLSATDFTIGSEAFKMSTQIRFVEAGGAYSISVQYTIRLQ